MRTARTSVLVAFFSLFIALTLLLVGCGDDTVYDPSDGSAPAGGGPGGGVAGSDEAGADGSSGTGATASSVSSTEPPTPNGLDLEAVRGWLAAAPFAYVAESDIDDGKVRSGHTAFIDSATDQVPWRPEAGKTQSEVAVSPDGTRVYVTADREPEVYVLDAETRALLNTISVPGLQARDDALFERRVRNNEAFAYADMLTPLRGMACTPDGTRLLLTTAGGLMVIDTADFGVTTPLPELQGAAIAVSFDGRRAYCGVDPLFTSDEKHTLAEWAARTSEADLRGELVTIDLETYEIMERREMGLPSAIAVRPDDTEVFVGDLSARAVHVVDAGTLDDLAVIPVEQQPISIGVLPDGSKAYAVCWGDQQVAGSFFAAVMDTTSDTVVKKIPLDMY